MPFALFVSLSAGDNVLPSMGSEYATGDSSRGTATRSDLGGAIDRRGKKAKGLLKATIDGMMEWVGEAGGSIGLWKGDKRRF